MAQTRSQNKTAAKKNDGHSNKKPKVFANEPSSDNETFLARYHRDFALIGQFVLPIIFSGISLAQTSCPIFLKLDILAICKGKPYLELSKLILNWTVRKN